MKAETKIVLGMLAVIGVIAVAAYAFSAPAVQNSEQINTVIEQSVIEAKTYNPGAVHYKGHVQVSVLRADTGIRTIVADKDNLITNGGVNFIRDKLTGVDANNTNRTWAISLSSSGVTPLTTWTQIDSELTTNGFARNSTGYYQTNGTGAYNISATWTATGTQNNIELTGLQWNNASNSNGNLFAALQFTNQSLLVNDILQINWSIFIS